MPSVPIGALIARIDSSSWFAATPGTVMTAPQAGRLYFGYNDGISGDNSGSYSATVSVARKLATPARKPSASRAPTASAHAQAGPPSGSAAPAPNPQALAMPAGMHVVDGGPGGDHLCNAVYLSSHPGDTGEQQANPLRVGWLPGQTKLWLNDHTAYDSRQVEEPGAAWNWTCGPPGSGRYITWQQFTWDCSLLHPGVADIRAHAKDNDDAYSWNCIAPT